MIIVIGDKIPYREILHNHYHITVSGCQIYKAMKELLLALPTLCCKLILEWSIEPIMTIYRSTTQMLPYSPSLEVAKFCDYSYSSLVEHDLTTYPSRDVPSLNSLSPPGASARNRERKKAGGIKT